MLGTGASCGLLCGRRCAYPPTDERTGCVAWPKTPKGHPGGRFIHLMSGGELNPASTEVLCLRLYMRSRVVVLAACRRRTGARRLAIPVGLVGGPGQAVSRSCEYDAKCPDLAHKHNPGLTAPYRVLKRQCVVVVVGVRICGCFTNCDSHLGMHSGFLLARRIPCRLNYSCDLSPYGMVPQTPSSRFLEDAVFRAASRALLRPRVCRAVSCLWRANLDLGATTLQYIASGTGVYPFALDQADQAVEFFTVQRFAGACRVRMHVGGGTGQGAISWPPTERLVAFHRDVGLGDVDLASAQALDLPASSETPAS